MEDPEVEDVGDPGVGARASLERFSQRPEGESMEEVEESDVSLGREGKERKGRRKERKEKEEWRGGVGWEGGR